MREYGENEEAVHTILAMVGLLDRGRMYEIAESWDSRGPKKAPFTRRIAELAGRREQAAKAAWDASVAVQMHMIGEIEFPIVRSCCWAAQEAALAACTQDLIGENQFARDEYDALMEPWLAGFGGTSIGWRHDEG